MKASGTVAALAWLAAMMAAVPCRAQPPNEAARFSDYAVKAAYLYKFASYVDWPEDLLDAASPLRIGVLGAQDLAEELALITSGRTVDGRSITVTRLRSSDTVDDLHILFVGRDESGRLERLLAPARIRPILTVTDSDDALTAGSIINFIVSDERVRFEISLFEAEQRGLRIDSRLLAVAQGVFRAAE
jgi:hypothetical protein